MGKKARKTKWKTLIITDVKEENSIEITRSSASERFNRISANSSRFAQNCHYDKAKPRIPLHANDGINVKFNEDEYTRITTPRQDVLFKKGYLSKSRTYNNQVANENYSDGDHNCGGRKPGNTNWHQNKFATTRVRRQFIGSRHKFATPGDSESSTGAHAEEQYPNCNPQCDPYFPFGMHATFVNIDTSIIVNGYHENVEGDETGDSDDNKPPKDIENNPPPGDKTVTSSNNLSNISPEDKNLSPNDNPANLENVKESKNKLENKDILKSSGLKPDAQEFVPRFYQRNMVPIYCPRPLMLVPMQETDPHCDIAHNPPPQFLMQEYVVCHENGAFLVCNDLNGTRYLMEQYYPQFRGENAVNEPSLEITETDESLDSVSSEIQEVKSKEINAQTEKSTELKTDPAESTKTSPEKDTPPNASVPEKSPVEKPKTPTKRKEIKIPINIAETKTKTNVTNEIRNNSPNTKSLNEPKNINHTQIKIVEKNPVKDREIKYNENKKSYHQQQKPSSYNKIPYQNHVVTSPKLQENRRSPLKQRPLPDNKFIPKSPTSPTIRFRENRNFYPKPKPVNDRKNAYDNQLGRTHQRNYAQQKSAEPKCINIQVSQNDKSIKLLDNQKKTNDDTWIPVNRKKKKYRQSNTHFDDIQMDTTTPDNSPEEEKQMTFDGEEITSKNSFDTEIQITLDEEKIIATSFVEEKNQITLEEDKVIAKEDSQEESTNSSMTVSKVSEEKIEEKENLDKTSEDEIVKKDADNVEKEDKEFELSFNVKTGNKITIDDSNDAKLEIKEEIVIKFDNADIEEKDETNISQNLNKSFVKEDIISMMLREEFKQELENNLWELNDEINSNNLNECLNSDCRDKSSLLHLEHRQLDKKEDNNKKIKNITMNNKNDKKKDYKNKKGRSPPKINNANNSQSVLNDSKTKNPYDVFVDHNLVCEGDHKTISEISQVFEEKDETNISPSLDKSSVKEDIISMVLREEFKQELENNLWELKDEINSNNLNECLNSDCHDKSSLLHLEHRLLDKKEDNNKKIKNITINNKNDKKKDNKNKKGRSPPKINNANNSRSVLNDSKTKNPYDVFVDHNLVCESDYKTNSEISQVFDKIITKNMCSNLKTKSKAEEDSCFNDDTFQTFLQSTISKENNNYKVNNSIFKYIASDITNPPLISNSIRKTTFVRNKSIDEISKHLVDNLTNDEASSIENQEKASNVTKNAYPVTEAVKSWLENSCKEILSPNALNNQDLIQKGLLELSKYQKQNKIPLLYKNHLSCCDSNSPEQNLSLDSLDKMWENAYKHPEDASALKILKNGIDEGILQDVNYLPYLQRGICCDIM